MWNRAFMRLLSLSFTAFFVVSLLWRETRRDKCSAAAVPADPKGDKKTNAYPTETTR